MDERRLRTGDVLAAGILNKPVEKNDIPTDQVAMDPETDSMTYAGPEAVIAALLGGMLVERPNYYGVVSAWKATDGTYRCVLMQYCSVTESETYATPEEAEEWFRSMYYQTYG